MYVTKSIFGKLIASYAVLLACLIAIWRRTGGESVNTRLLVTTYSIDPQ
jgi:hypothetical protein